MDFNALMEKIPAFLANNGLKLIAAILIYVIGKWIASALTKVFRRYSPKARWTDTLVSFWEISSMPCPDFCGHRRHRQAGRADHLPGSHHRRGRSGSGLALQGSLSNFASGVMLILFKTLQSG
jgi:small conductance mechanosensitive channel